MSDVVPLRRRRLQYSLGSLFIVLAVCAVALAWFVRLEHRSVEHKVLGRPAIEGLGSMASTKGAGRNNAAAISALNAGLNELGAEGWELVAVEPEHRTTGASGSSHRDVTYVFKRNR